ncbi:MAG TPA: DUF1573 domain-containing protein [Thermoanaerobaculia bacterium]|nr:DUF1573 domain-containing protein [Thermoanaerobaculia bacterium]
MRRFLTRAAVPAILAAAVALGSSPVSAAAPAPAKKPAPAAAPAADKVGTPKISVDPMLKDAGTVAKGDHVEAVFTVKNSGTQDLVISDARPSCGCTVASFDRTIKPGQTGKITAAVDTKNFSGPITKTVSVVSNDPETPQLALTIKAIVKPYVEVAPQEFVRFSAIRGDTASQDLILYSSEKDFHPTVAESSQPYVKAQVSPAADKEKLEGKAGEQYKLHVTLESNAPVGVLNAPVHVKTGVAKQPDMEIRVSGIVRDRISVTPASIVFGNFTPGKDVISRNVIFTNNKPAQAVRVQKVETTVSGVSAEVVPMTEGVNYTIVLKPKTDLKKGEFSGMLKIYTSDKERPEIDVPLTGNVL